MEKLLIEGGQRLEGEVVASGSKNAALPILAACLLTEEPMMLHRIPRVRDIRTMEKLMAHIGATLTKEPNGPHHVTCDKHRRSGSAVRSGEDDARIQPGARAAGGALRACPRVDAGRLCDRVSANQSARGRRWNNSVP